MFYMRASVPTLYKNAKPGYRFHNDLALKIASCGYADDLLTFAESWKDEWMIHQWILEFCHAHAFKINVNKCRYLFPIGRKMALDGFHQWTVRVNLSLNPLQLTFDTLDSGYRCPWIGVSKFKS